MMSNQQQIYLDYNATTPVHESVLEAMLPYFATHFGNASSKGHAMGWRAEAAVTIAREQVAELFSTDPDTVIFTSGSTEAINLAIKGTATRFGHERTHIVTSQTEHKAVLDTCTAIEKLGASVTRVAVDKDGAVNVADLRNVIKPETRLVSIMWANNETGVLNDVDAIADVCKDAGVPFFSDATQAPAKLDTRDCPADLIAISAHKFYGPKGVGALINKGNVALHPLINGGGQESGVRGGTLNVTGIVGMGSASEWAVKNWKENSARLKELRDRFEEKIGSSGLDVHLVGKNAPRLPNTCGLLFPGLKAANLLSGLRGLALSTGSACQSGSGKGSHVMKALGYSSSDAQSFIRVSIGSHTKLEEIDRASQEIIDAVHALTSKA